jgi:hypothetical protein
LSAEEEKKAKKKAKKAQQKQEEQKKGRNEPHSDNGYHSLLEQQRLHQQMKTKVSIWRPRETTTPTASSC